MPDVISRKEGEGAREEVGENPIEKVEEGTGVQLLSCIIKKSR